MRKAIALATGSEVAPLRVLHSVSEIGADAQQLGADGCCVRDERVGRMQVGADRDAAGAEDAGLFATDILARRTQIIGVVHRNRGDDRHVGVDDVDRVEPAAQPDFEDPRVEPRLREQPQRGERAEFLLEKGAIDMIVDRRQLREELPRLLALLQRQPVPTS